MTDPNFQDDDLARRLDWATSSQPPAADADPEAADLEAARWRESWVALGRHLDAGAPSLDTSALLAKLQAELEPTPKASPVEAPQGAWWLAIALAVAALLAGGWWAIRQWNVTTDGNPNGAPLAGPEKIVPPSKNLAPEEKPSPPAVVQQVTPKSPTPPDSPSSEELTLTAWDDAEVDQLLTQVKTQVYGANAEWHESQGLDLLDERLQELDGQMDDGSF